MKVILAIIALYLAVIAWVFIALRNAPAEQDEEEDEL